MSSVLRYIRINFLSFLFFFFVLFSITPFSIVLAPSVFSVQTRPILVSSDFVITVLDSIFECKAYRILGLSDIKNCEEEKTVRMFALLSVLRKKFENFIGFHDEAAKLIMEGRWDSIVKIQGSKDYENIIKELMSLGYSQYEIENEMRSIILFSEKLRNTIGVEIMVLVEYSNEYVMYGGKIPDNKKSEEQKIQMKMINDFVRSFLPPDLRFE